jgi:cytidine deaminase
MNYQNLVENAIKIRESAYAPYSKFKVGAAILTQKNKIYCGCNVECAAYSHCTCAEKIAVFKAISERIYDFSAIAVVGGVETEIDNFSSYCPPCGSCRQVLREFCDPETFEIVLAKNIDEFKVFKLEKLLPNSFGPKYLIK